MMPRRDNRHPGAYRMTNILGMEYQHNWTEKNFRICRKISIDVDENRRRIAKGKGC
jgi:hypothetical protein